MFSTFIDVGTQHVCARCFTAALISATGFIQPGLADDAAPPLQIAFHVDVVGNQFSDQLVAPLADPLPNPLVDAMEGDDDDRPSLRAMEFKLIGLPVKVGMKEEDDDARMGLAAGLQGDYELALSERLSVVASATLSKTGYLDNSWSAARTTANTALRYKHDGLLLALEPSWRIDMMETGVTQSDYGATARFTKTMFQNVDFSGGVRYGRHDAWNPADDYANATAYATVSYRIAGRMKLDLSYATTYKLPDQLQAGSLSLDDLRYAENSAGPTVTMAFPLWDALDIAATYRYCRSADDVPRRGSDRRIDDMQSFDMSATWHAEDATIGGINFTAAYGYDRLASTDPDAEEQAHAATIAMALPF